MKSVKLIILSCILSVLFITKVTAQTVYITKTGTKYHTKKCPEVKKSKIKIDLKEAEKKGYTACPMCDADKVKPKGKDSVTEEKVMPKKD